MQLNGRGYAATWDDEGRTILIGSGEPSLLAWDVEWARSEGSVFVAHRDPVRAVAVQPAGWTLISGSPDGSLAVVAVMVMEVGPVAVGTEAHVNGLGVGGSVSGMIVVAEARGDAIPTLGIAAKSRAVTR